MPQIRDKTFKSSPRPRYKPIPRPRVQAYRAPALYLHFQLWLRLLLLELSRPNAGSQITAPVCQHKDRGIGIDTTITAHQQLVSSGDACTHSPETGSLTISDKLSKIRNTTNFFFLGIPQTFERVLSYLYSLESPLSQFLPDSY